MTTSSSFRYAPPTRAPSGPDDEAPGPQM